MAATTATRSTRRADGLHHPHLYHPLHHQPVHQSHPQLMAPSTRNMKPNMAVKRHLPPLERDLDAVKRKRHFVVELPSKAASHRLHNSHTSNNNKSTQAAQATVASSQSIARPPEPAPQRPPVAKPKPSTTINNRPSVAGTAVTVAAAPPPQQSASTATSSATRATNPTKHKEKVSNGLKHELDRLQPSEAVTKEQGRKLRSQEATRFKSDLSAYFPDYDEVIGNDPKEHHLLNVDTPIVIADTRPPLPPSLPLTAAAQSSTYTLIKPLQQPSDSYPVRSYGDNLFTDLCDSQRIDFNFLKAQHKGTSDGDPLPDLVFQGPHKKAERLERSIRNLEKGRAQHEKDQIIRLLDGLQGPDWLKIMGVSGITEGKKKSFEPARAHFIKGCQAILDKFRRWTAEEKRRKQEKDRRDREAKALRDSQEKDDTSDAEEEQQEDAQEEEEDAGSEEDREIEVEDDDADDSDGDPPDSLDIDASIAKQLRDEALAAAKTNARSRARARDAKRSGSEQAQAPDEPKPFKEFKSFFSKPYQRAAALGKNRRRGRTVLAWGQPMPDVPERDFELPDDILDEETLKAQARRKRKERRGKT